MGDSAVEKRGSEWIIGFVIAGAVLGALVLICGIGLLLLLVFGVRASSLPVGTSPALPPQPSRSPAETPSPLSPTPTASPLPLPTVHPSDIPSATVTPLPTVSGDLLAELQAVELRVAALRELEPQAEVTKSFMPVDELRQRVSREFLADYSPEDAQADTLVYASLGLVPPDFDLYNFYINFYSENIAGYYDPETQQIFVISQNTTLTAADEWTYSHEFTHALQDQYFDLLEFLHDDNPDWYVFHADEALARTALIEGDAMVMSMLYLARHFTDEQWAELVSLQATVSPLLESAPPALIREFYFPYTHGLAFVQALYEYGGFELVNQAYIDPPTTTEQILHPELYINRDEPTDIVLESALEVLGEGYVELRRQEIGEFTLQLYLGEVLSDSTSASASAGWDGGELAVYADENSDSVVLVMLTAWDGSIEADEFSDAMEQYAVGSSSVQLDSDHETMDCWDAEVFCVARWTQPMS
jgi:hypothetical protein